MEVVSTGPAGTMKNCTRNRTVESYLPLKNERTSPLVQFFILKTEDYCALFFANKTNSITDSRPSIINFPNCNKIVRRLNYNHDALNRSSTASRKNEINEKPKEPSTLLIKRVDT